MGESQRGDEERLTKEREPPFSAEVKLLLFVQAGCNMWCLSLVRPGADAGFPMMNTGQIWPLTLVDLWPLFWGLQWDRPYLALQLCMFISSIKIFVRAQICSADAVECWPQICWMCLFFGCAIILWNRAIPTRSTYTSCTEALLLHEGFQFCFTTCKTDVIIHYHSEVCGQ